MKLNARELEQAKKALKYHRQGIPLKDAFDGPGSEEWDLYVKALKIAVEQSK